MAQQTQKKKKKTGGNGKDKDEERQLAGGGGSGNDAGSKTIEKLDELQSFEKDYHKSFKGQDY